jgi:Flp pilus assembly protein TadD
MKKIKLSLFAALIAVIALSGCGGLNKMKDQAKLITYSQTPNPLEVKGGQIEYSIQGKIPPKFFNKSAICKATPLLKYNGKTDSLKSLTLQGEKVQANNKVIAFETGGDFTMADKIPFTKDMMLSTVEVSVKAGMGKTIADFGSLKIGEGVIATEYLVVKDPRVIFVPTDHFVRSNASEYQTDIKYVMSKADVRPAEIKKPEIAKLNELLKGIDADPKKAIKGIELSAYASPDGPLDENDKLAAQRKESANTYFKKEVTKAKLTKVKDDIFKYLTTAEDWDGFKKLMEASDIKDKELVLRVLSMYSDPVVREKEIKNISATFDEIKDKILPQLRRSKFTVTYEDAGKTDAELLATAQSTPDSLQLEELLFAAKLTTDTKIQLAIYEATAKKFPADFRAKNNIGYLLYQDGKIAEAKAAFEAAQQVENNSVVKNNIGAITLAAGDLAKAEELLVAAVGAGDQVNYNLGIIKIVQGKYTDAINYFGNTNEANTALALILAKQNDKAKAVLADVKSQDAIVDYLKAIVGARLQNTDMLFNNLRAAAGKSADLKANAAKDMEFAKYFTDATFKGIIQ